LVTEEAGKSTELLNGLSVALNQHINKFKI